MGRLDLKLILMSATLQVRNWECTYASEGHVCNCKSTPTRSKIRMPTPKPQPKHKHKHKKKQTAKLSAYFGGCPVATIGSTCYPVQARKQSYLSIHPCI